MEKLIAILLSLAILSQAWVIRRYVGTWIFPACLFSWFWFLFTIIPLVALYTVPVNPLAVAYILMICCVFSAVSFLFPWKNAFAQNSRPENQPDFANLTLQQAFNILSVLAVICILVGALQRGFTFSWSLVALMRETSTFITDRYSGNATGLILSQLAFVSMYTAAVIGGLILPPTQRNIFFKKSFLLAFLPATLLLIIEGNKGALPLVAVMFWGGLLVQKIKSGETELFGPNSLKQALYLLAVFFPLIVFSFMARGLYEESNFSFVLEQLTRYFASYSSAHLYAFSDWFTFYSGGQATQNFENVDMTGGFYTFMSIFRIFGDDRFVPDGVYDEYFRHGTILQSNIYTAFRGLITDFGLFGSMIVAAVFSFLVHLSFYGLLTKRDAAFHVAVFAHVIGIFYTSFIISLMIWNSIYISMFGVTMTLLISQSIQSRQTTKAM